MLTFEEWRHTYADVFETDDAARAAWTAASNKGYSAGVQDTRELLAAHSAGAQEPVAWHSIPDAPPVESMEWYGDQLSAPVLLHDGEKILQFVARWSFPDGGWVDAQLSNGPSPDDYTHLNAKRWMLLSDVADCAKRQPLPQTASTGAQTHKIIDDGEVTGYVVPSVAAQPQPMPDSAGAQEPVAWRYRTPTGWHATPKIDKALRVSAYHDVQPLYTQPQPMPQTDAARDQLRHFANAERFNRAVFADDSAFADWVIRRSRHVLAEIERIDRAKGE